MELYDRFPSSTKDKDHKGRYGMWRLPEYREAEKPNWTGRTPKFVTPKQKLLRQWHPPDRETTLLIPGVKYACSVNSQGVTLIYPGDGSPPIPARDADFYITDFWST